jgi:hypothetical protein
MLIFAETLAIILQTVGILARMNPVDAPIVRIMIVSAATISIIAIAMVSYRAVIIIIATTQKRVRARLEIQLAEIDAGHRMAVAIGDRLAEAGHILSRKRSALLQLLDAIRDRTEELSTTLFMRRAALQALDYVRHGFWNFRE